MPFSIPVRIYWEDTDAGGVVYHARYLHFFERARTEWLRALGIEQAQLRREQGLVFAIRNVSVEFLRPARLDDLLLATVSRVERRPASLGFAQELLREPGGQVLAQAKVRAACLDAETFRPCPIPDAMIVGEWKE